MAYRPMSLCSMLAASAFSSAAFAGGNPECPNPAHDCFTTGTAGCSDEACCNIVCNDDPFCCSVSWDGLCVDGAELLCPSCPGLCVGDLDGDGMVGAEDLAILLGEWGNTDSCACLLDCPVDANDLAVLLGAWGPCPVPAPCEEADHDCCTLGGPGCTDTDCCEIVCAADPFCCSNSWDGLCVGQAVSLCGLECGDCPPSDHDCCTTGAPGCTDTDCCATVCAADPFCCTVAWDGLCVGEAESFCGLVCFGCGVTTHDCCTTGAPGCSDVDCCELVCSVDTFCCSVAWDGLCVGQAVSLCGLDCAADCPESDHDCYTTGIPGCTDVECCGLVCLVDGFCCSVAWDGICVAEAFSLCGTPECPFECDGVAENEPCGEDTNGGCNVPIIGDSNCCIPNGGLGCDNEACTSAVCGVDPFCCSVAWDGICAAEALSLCPDICMLGEPQFGLLECGQTLCGTAWASGGTRDTDWFIINIPGNEKQTITMTCSSQLPMVFGLINSIDCATATAIFPLGTTGFCGTSSLEICLNPGENWLFAAPNGFDGFPCDSGANQYSLTIDCLGTVCLGNCPESDHDCYSTGAPGCTDAECCDAVCSLDAFCCSVAWDGFCVNEAFSLCGVPECPFECTGTSEGEPCGQDLNGGCNVPIIGDSNCCTPWGGLGCDDGECASAVCGVDPFCCSVAWDGLCAGEALSLCPDICMLGTPQFGSLSCGETMCGTAWASGGTRDTDWFKIFVKGKTQITMTCSSQLPMIYGLINSTDCATATEILPFNTTGYCGTTSLDICLADGENWLFAAPNSFDGWPCESGANQYSLTITCGGECVLPVNCCIPWGGLGCEDDICTSIVCGADPFCCSVAWDGLCAGAANSLCEVCQ